MSAPRKVVGIDPGINGAFVVFDGTSFASFPMPVIVSGKDKNVDFEGLHALLKNIQEVYTPVHVFLEKAVSFGMGTKAAFSYGRGFEAIVVALSLLRFSVTMVEPGKWTKEMHEGISSDLKPKVKSGIAVQRLYPQLVGQLPKKMKGGLHDGPMDALLIAGYGLRKLGAKPPVSEDMPDFY